MGMSLEPKHPLNDEFINDIFWWQKTYEKPATYV